MKQYTSSQSPLTQPFADKQADLRFRCLRGAFAILLAVACFCTPTHVSAQVLITLTPYTGTVNGQVNLQAYPGTQTADATIAVSYSLGPVSSPSVLNLAPITITGAAASWLQEDTGLYPSCFGGGAFPINSFYLNEPPFCSLPLYFMVPPGTSPGIYPVNVTVSASYNPTNAEFAQSVVVNIEVLPLPTGSGSSALNFVPTLTTFAGMGQFQGGYNGDNIAATSAKLNRPSDIAIDSTGNVYIADTANFLIRKVDTAGKITTYAGLPQNGGAGNYTGEGGQATSATLEGPGAIAIGPSGDLYFTDGITSVRKIDVTTGVITTYAGPVNYQFGYSGDGGPATSALFYGPDSLAFDPDGNLYIGEFWTNDVRVVNKATGIITTYAGQNTWNNVAVGTLSSPPYPGYSGDGGLATKATLYRPYGLAFRPGNAVAGPGNTLFIADGENHRVRTVDPATGDINTVIGMGAWGVGSAASVGAEGTPATTAALYPESIALDSIGNAYILSVGTLFKVDGTGNIYQYPSTSTSVLFGGNGDTENVKVSRTGDIYIAAANNHKIFKITPANSLDFGIVNVGSSSTGQFLTLQNTGSGLLFFNPTPYTIAGDFTVGNAGTCSFSAALTVGSSCTVQITFSPITAGGQTGSITFNTNDPGTALSATLTGTGAGPGLTISPGFLTFPDTVVGTTSAAQQITLTAGLTAVNFVGQGIIMTGGNASHFPQTNNCGTTLAADTACTINVMFTPTNTFTLAAQLSVSSDVGGFQQTFVSVGGKGIPAPAPIATLSPGFINFPNTPVGTSSTQQMIQLSNTGNAALVITGTSITGPDAGSYSLNNTCPGTLAVGTPACNIFITFVPTSTASTTAYLTITDNATGGEQDASLGGTGTVPVATLSTNALTFPTTQVGHASPVQTVTIQNTGGAQLNVTSVSLQGANPGSYYLTHSCGILAPGVSCGININFQPIASGTRNATIIVTDNTTASPHSISLTGVGNAQQSQFISFSPLPAQVTTSSTPLPLSASGGASGNPVTFTVTGPGTIVGNTLKITGLGTIKVTASQAGNTSYLAATPVAQTITVSAFLAPTISNEQATSSSASAETLSAFVNPNNASTTWWFAFGLSPTTMTQTSPVSTGLMGTSPIDVLAAAFNLPPGTTYYYRAVAKSAGGQTLGPTQTFTTP